jgi:hypothetical protein
MEKRNHYNGSRHIHGRVRQRVNNVDGKLRILESLVLRQPASPLRGYPTFVPVINGPGKVPPASTVLRLLVTTSGRKKH